MHFQRYSISGKIDGVFYEVPVTLNDMSTQMHTFFVSDRNVYTF